MSSPLFLSQNPTISFEMTEPFERWNGIAQVGAENKRKEREREKQIKGKKREKVPLVQEEVKK